MTRLEVALTNILGYFPFYMRAPYLSYSTTMLNTLATLKYVVVDIDIDPEDWRYNTKDTTQYTQQIFKEGIDAGNGLTLLHDPQQTTNEDVIPYVINYLKSKGLVCKLRNFRRSMW
jgi:peptidoglycan/xylan/chitin deacetylase (PgdA/CDA1 family)